MILDTKNVNLIAVYTGEKGQAHCVCKCPCCSQKGPDSLYQGNLSQINDLLDIFPNLEQLYIFGNPDPVVDPDFCNKAALLSISRGVNVCFSTSGVGGKEMLKKLLKDIDPKNVDYISFSIDSINPEKMSMLKGIKYPWLRAIEGIDWVISQGYNVKIQPTLWSSNYLDAYSIIEFFTLRGVKKYSFHIGSVERADVETHQHLTSNQIQQVHKQIDLVTKKYADISVNCPVIYPSCGNNDDSKWYCMKPSQCYNWLVFLKETGVWGTHVPIASEFNDKYIFNLKEPINVEPLEEKETCPLSNKTTNGSKTLCRYITKKWNW